MDPTIVAAAGSKFLESGVLGALVVVLLAVSGGLWRAYANANEARIKEGDEAADRYVELLGKVMAGMNDTNTILQVIKDRMGRKE